MKLIAGLIGVGVLLILSIAILAHKSDEIPAGIRAQCSSNNPPTSDCAIYYYDVIADCINGYVVQTGWFGSDAASREERRWVVKDSLGYTQTCKVEAK